MFDFRPHLRLRSVLALVLIVQRAVTASFHVGKVFGINPRNAIDDALNTTFIYDSPDFAPFSGAIEHTGRVQFNDSIEVGDFTIRAADNRPAGTSSFVVESTFGLNAILFDIANPIIEAFDNSLVIGADLLVSPELAAVLGNEAATGADAGMALVVANSTVVPIPAAVWLFEWFHVHARVALQGEQFCDKTQRLEYQALTIATLLTFFRLLPDSLFTAPVAVI